MKDKILQEMNDIMPFDSITGEQASYIKEAMDRYVDYCSNKWISIDDKLPKENEFVLCYDGNIIVSEYSKGRDRNLHFWHADISVTLHPTHWMPLPEIPDGI